MDLLAPYRVVLSRSDGSALAVLASERGPLTGREVAKLGGLPKTTVARALGRLAEHGLVTARDMGRGRYTLYSLNREHLAADPVLRLLELSNTLVERLAKAIAGWSMPPLNASLLGPYATDLGVTSNEIEIVVVRGRDLDAYDATWLRQLNELSERVRRWTGNEAVLVQIAGEDLDSLRHERPPLVRELETESVTLFGPAFRVLIRSGGRASRAGRVTLGVDAFD